MNGSLPEHQRRFAAWLDDPDGAPERLAVYRNTVTANYRNALGATYRVVRELVGAPFFDAAVDAFVRVHPSTSGDLNLFGGEFADFLAAYPHARELAYLPDVARLEWALDEAQRAADPQGSPTDVLAGLGALATNDMVRLRFTLDPSCRLLRSDYPVMRIWQAHQSTHDGDMQVDLGAGADFLLIRREGEAPVIVRLPAGEFAWLAALARGDDVAAALEAALEGDPTFDLGTALGKYIADGTIMSVGRASARRGLAAG